MNDKPQKVALDSDDIRLLNRLVTRMRDTLEADLSLLAGSEEYLDSSIIEHVAGQRDHAADLARRFGDVLGATSESGSLFDDDEPALTPAATPAPAPRGRKPHTGPLAKCRTCKREFKGVPALKQHQTMVHKAPAPTV